MDRRNLLKTVTLAGSAVAVPALVAPALADEKNAAAPLIEKFASTLSAHDLTAFALLFSDSYVNHQLSAAAPPSPQGKSAKQGTVAVFNARLAGIPDLKVEIEATIASGDRAAASFVYSGTHNGPLSGVAPTGRTLRFTSCDIFRVKDGLIVEHWGMGDIAGVLAQLKA
jgi:predicted ester cyclase